MTPVEAMHTDEYWMAQALQLARRGLATTTPNPAVGCILVREGVKVGEGYHRKAGTDHAEAHALTMAGEQARGATAYVTLEPCSHHGRTPPCSDALIKAGVVRVVCAIEDPNPKVAGQGLAKLAAAGVETKSGVLAAEAEAINLGFLQRMRTGRPWLRLKMASSLDGATALASGESQWITGPQARQDVQRGRAEACAVLTGVGTVLSDDPALSVRLAQVERQPARVVLDSQLHTPPSARIFRQPGATWVVHGEDAPAERMQALAQAGALTVALPLGSDGRLDLGTVLDWMGRQHWNLVWAECGARLAGSLIGGGWANELWLYQAPKFLGASARPLMDWSIHSLKDALNPEVMDIRQVGRDLRWRLRLTPST
ncbi:MAG: bifunctional diaminohydroxyphosphoribosylaminopyrimidine deaminase/5-amino-6-(5-phosphoribosylamino)uracil reductase RibD [Saccharospirillum sp.]